MPYYSELGIYTPTSSYTSSLLKGPYAAHSSIIASNILPPSKFRPQFRNYKPHLTTINESANIPKYIAPKVRVRPVKINTADIENSLRYHPPQRSQKEAKPNRVIRRDRATIRLQTIHKDTVEKGIGEIKSWRDNFEPDELTTDSKRHKKTPGELLKEKFLIRCKSKENVASLKKSPSFKDICQNITSDVKDLNPGQPIEVRRRQSRRFSHDDIMKEIQRSSSSLSAEEVQILDALIQAENEVGLYEPVKKKKKKSDSAAKLRRDSLVEDAKDISEVVKTDWSDTDMINSSRSETDISKLSNEKKNVSTSRLRKDSSVKNMVKDISQVEIEMIPTKQKPVIKGHIGDITEKSNIKLVVEDMQIEESPKKEKKFRFNVTVQEFPVKKKILLPKQTSEEVVSPSAAPQKGLVTSILKKQNKAVVGHIQKPKVKKVRKVSELKKTEEEVNNFTVTVSPPSSGKFKVMSIKGDKCEKNEDISDSKVEDISINQNQKNVDTDSQINVAFKLPRNIERQEGSIIVANETADLTTSEQINLEEKTEVTKKVNNEGKTNKKNGSETKKSKAGVSEKKKENAVEKSISEIIGPGKGNAVFEKNETSNIISDIQKVVDNVKPEENEISDKLNYEIKNTSSDTEKLNSETIEHSNILEKADCSQNMKQGLTLFASKRIEKEDDKISTPNKDNQEILTKDISVVNNHQKNEVTCETDVTNIRRSQSLKNEKQEMKKRIVKKTKSVEKKKKQETEAMKRSDEFESNEPDQCTSDRLRLKGKECEEKKPTSNMAPDSDSVDASTIWTDEDTYEPPKLGKLKLDQKDPHEILKEIQNGLQHLPESPEEKQKRIMSKRSLIQKANKSDPDLKIFEPPTPPIPDEKEPTPEPSFVPLKSNSFSKWMHPWKKPEQTDDSLDIYAKPKFIRARHIPRRWRNDTYQSDESEDSTTSEEESGDSEGEDNEDEEQEIIAECKVGASYSSSDSGFESGRKNKGSIDSRDSPGNTLNPASNPAFALDFNDLPEEVSQSSTYQNFQKSGRITPPATTIPRFRKYCVDDFNFLKVLGKGSFGKVLLAELKGTEYYYAVKCLKKDVVLEDDDVECTLIERKVLALGTKHPYLCHLLCTFQTESHLFFVMEYLNGGDLMFHIQAERRFSEARARFYGAEIVSGLRFLHNKGIVYRDLKLDNILLDFDGHVRIADFGMCKLQIFLDRMADTFCGTPDYMAPEIIKGQHYNQCVDWWSFGVLLYEMLLGQSPFSGSDEDELFWSICNEKPVIPRFLSAEAGSVLLQFLEKDGNKRLGHRFSPHGDIQDHPFFKPIDWAALEARQLEPPFKPNLHHPLDTQYFDRTFTTERAKLTPIESGILQSMDQTQFQGFSYTNPNATDK